MPNALGGIVLIEEMPLTCNTCMAIMDLAKFSKQKGSKPKTYFYEKKQQFGESHLKILSLLVVVVRRVFKNFLFIPVVPIPERGQTRGLRPAWPGCLRQPRCPRKKAKKFF